MATKGSGYGAIQNTELYTSLDIYEPQVRKQLTGKQPKFNDFDWMVQLGRMGRIDPQQMISADSHKWKTWEQAYWLKATFTIDSVSNTGSDVEITIDSDDHYRSGKSSFPIVGDTVEFKNGTAGYVKSIDRSADNGHVVTITSLKGDDVQAASSADESVLITSRVDPEQSTGTETRYPDFDSYTQYLQTIRYGHGITDHEMQEKTWFEWEDANGNKRNAAYMVGLEDAADVFRYYMSAGMLVGQESSSLTDANSNALQTTKGLWHNIADQGITANHDGVIDMPYWDSLYRKLTKNYGDSDYAVEYGYEWGLKANAFVRDFQATTDSNINFDAVGGKDQYLNFNFKQLEYGKFRFMLKENQTLSDPASIGADGFKYKHSAIFLPLGDTVVKTNPKGAKQSLPMVRIVYTEPLLAEGWNKGHYGVWETGAGASQGPTNEKMEKKVHFICHKGFEMHNRYKFMKSQDSTI